MDPKTKEAWLCDTYGEGVAANTFSALGGLGDAAKNDAELGKNRIDCEALAWLGRYYASKIRGACTLSLYDGSADEFEHLSAIRHLTDAHGHWKRYAEVRDAHCPPHFTIGLAK